MPIDNGPSKPRLDTLQRIELAEGVEIRLRTAGPYVRVLAYMLDLLIRVGVAIVASILLSVIGLLAGGRVSEGLNLILIFFLTFFYYIVFEAGKRAVSYTHLTLPTILLV